MPDDLLYDQYNEAALLTARANCRTGGSDAQTAEFKQALQKVDALLELEPDHRSCLLLKSELLKYMGDYKQAIQHTLSFVEATTWKGRKIAQLGKQQSLQYLQIADCHMKLEEWGSAAENLRNAMQLLKQEDAIAVRNVLHKIATCLLHQEDYAAAVQCSEHAITMNRTYPGACTSAAADSLFQLFICAEDEGAGLAHLDGAIRMVEQAVLYEEPWNLETRQKQTAKLKELRCKRQCFAHALRPTPELGSVD
jgi:tetratricopeptide (TPR) repeat protein